MLVCHISYKCHVLYHWYYWNRVSDHNAAALFNGLLFLLENQNVYSAVCIENVLFLRSGAFFNHVPHRWLYNFFLCKDVVEWRQASGGAVVLHLILWKMWGTTQSAPLWKERPWIQLFTYLFLMKMTLPWKLARDTDIWTDVLLGLLLFSETERRIRKNLPIWAFSCIVTWT